MSFTDLPTEIVRYIVEEIVLEPDNGLYNALRCRLISKTFDWEVLDAIRWLEVLHPRNATYGLWEQMSPRFVSRFLCHLSEKEHQKYRWTFASFLKLFLDEWIPPRNESKFTSYELAFQLCDIAHQQTGQTFHQICDIYFPFYQLPKERSKDVQSHLTIAAIYLKKEQYVKDNLSVLLQPNMRSEFFGTPLHAACAVGDLSLVRLLLRSGADPNERSLRAWYPIEIAVLNNSVEIVRELLRKEYNFVSVQSRMDDTRLYMFLFALVAHENDIPVWMFPDNCKRWLNFLRATYNAADIRESLIPLRVHFMLSLDEEFKRDEEDDETPPWGDEYSLLEVAHDEELMYSFITSCAWYFNFSDPF